jgi:hypothetical protein
MSEFPTQIGLPSSLSYDLPPSVADETRTYEVSISPDATQSVACGGIGAVFVLNSTCALTAFNQQQITFSIPSGHSNSVFIDPASTVLQGRLTYVVSTAANVTAPRCHIIGSMASFFESLTLYSNNTPIEQTSNYGPLYNQLMNATVNLAERSGGISVAAGADTNSYTGLDITTFTAGTYYINFAIPLLSVIGLNTRDKLFPVGSCGALMLAMQTSANLPISSYCSAITTAGVINNITLDQMSLNLKYVDIGESASAALRSSLARDSYFIKSTSYVNSNYTVPTGTSGSASCLLQIRNTSVKSIFGQFSQATAADTPNGIYDAVNPGLTSLQLSIAGWKRPQRPLNPSQRPAENFCEYMSAHGAASLKSYGGVITRPSWNACTTRPSGADDAQVVAGVTTAGFRDSNFGKADSALNLCDQPAMAYIGFDTDRIHGGLFAGTNTRMSPPFVDCYFGNATTTTLQLSAWALIDVIIEVNVPSKTVTVYN